jgi:hypothetical protein
VIAIVIETLGDWNSYQNVRNEVTNLVPLGGYYTNNELPVLKLINREYANV